MTYRLESDIPIPYGRVVPKKGGFTHTSEHKYSYNSTEFAEDMTKKSSKFSSLAHRPGAVT